MKRILCALLTAALLTTIGSAALAQSPAEEGGAQQNWLSNLFEQVFEGKKDAPDADAETYELDSDVLPSIPAVVGRRECIAAETGAGGSLGELFERVKPTAATGGLGGIFESGGPTPQPTQSALPEPTPPPTEEPMTEPPLPALFDEGVRDITCAPYGNRVDYARIGDWTISRGYLFDQDLYCLIGQSPEVGIAALTDDLPHSIVPADDAFIYYGKDGKGKHNWLIRKPGEEPKNLPLGITDEVIYADSESIWYSTVIGREISLRRLTRKDNKKKGLGRVTGSALTMQEDGNILITDFARNRVLSWKNGKATAIYESKEQILNVASIGKSVWVEHEQEIGLLEDGALPWRLPGHIMSMTGTTDQFVLLLSHPDSSEYDVIIFNDSYRAYARVGYVPASEHAFVELHPDRQLTVWSPVQSLIFEVPPEDQWIPYGYYDVESAWAAQGC